MKRILFILFLVICMPAFAWYESGGWNFILNEADTLDTVCDRGSTTDQSITVGGISTSGTATADQVVASSIGIGLTPSHPLHIEKTFDSDMAVTDIYSIITNNNSGSSAIPVSGWFESHLGGAGAEAVGLLGLANTYSYDSVCYGVEGKAYTDEATSLSNAMAGGRFNSWYVDSTDTDADVWGAWGLADSNNQHGKTVGVYGSAYGGSRATAFEGSARNDNNSNMEFMYGFNVGIANEGTGTITYATGLNVPTFYNTGGGSITNAIGLFLSEQTAGGTNISAYLDGSGKAVFRDTDLGIYSSTDGQLDIFSNNEIELTASTIDYGSGNFIGSGKIDIDNVTVPTGLEFAEDISWISDWGNNAFPFAIRGYCQNTSSGAGQHGGGILGWAEDTADGIISLYGVEGKVQGHGASAISYIGLLGSGEWIDEDEGNGTTNISTVYGVLGRSWIYNNDQSTPRMEGTAISGVFQNPIGGKTAVGLTIQDITGHTTDIGLSIEGADTAALVVGSGADNTDAANGIMFGSSRDTDLYRSAANTLKTDDSLVVSGYTSSGGYEGIKRDIITHTMNATDVSNGYFTEVWSVATTSKVVSIRMVIKDVDDNNYLKEAKDVSYGVLYNGSGFVGYGTVALNDVATIVVEWVE